MKDPLKLCHVNIGFGKPSNNAIVQICERFSSSLLLFNAGADFKTMHCLSCQQPELSFDFM